MPIAISCRGLTKEYPTGAQPVRAVRGVDLEVPTGEMLMMVGPSGCGKTTLLSIVAGILSQTAGTCKLFDQDLAALSPKQRAALRARDIGFVFQQFQLIPTLTIQQNAAVPLLILGQPRSVAMAKAAASLDRVGLGDRLSSLPAMLSGGQQQRVAIARAIVHSPRLIVCDEPTSALDHRTGQEILELLRGLTVGGGCTLLVVTHDARIFNYADRIAEMDDGAIAGFRQKGLPHVS